MLLQAKFYPQEYQKERIVDKPKEETVKAEPPYMTTKQDNKISTIHLS